MVPNRLGYHFHPNFLHVLDESPLTNNSACFLILLFLCSLLFSLTQSAITLSPQVLTLWMGILCWTRKIISSLFLRAVGRAKLKALLSVWMSSANSTLSMIAYRPSFLHVYVFWEGVEASMVTKISLQQWKSWVTLWGVDKPLTLTIFEQRHCNLVLTFECSVVLKCNKQYWHRCYCRWSHLWG